MTFLDHHVDGLEMTATLEVDEVVLGNILEDLVEGVVCLQGH